MDYMNIFMLQERLDEIRKNSRHHTSLSEKVFVRIGEKVYMLLDAH